MKIDPKTVISIALLGGLGYVIYKFVKGDWKLPSLGEVGAGVVTTVLPGDIGRGALEGAETGGIPGGLGGITYNIFAPPSETLYERIREHEAEPTREIIPLISEETGMPPEQVTPEQITQRAIMLETAQDITQQPLFPLGLFPPFAGFTIGAGIAAIQKEAEYKRTLTPQEQYSYELAAWERRQAFMGTTAGTVAQILGFGIPTLLQHTLWKPTPPTPTITKAEVVTPEPLPTAEATEIPPKSPEMPPLLKQLITRQIISRPSAVTPTPAPATPTAPEPTPTPTPEPTPSVISQLPAGQMRDILYSLQRRFR